MIGGLPYTTRTFFLATVRYFPCARQIVLDDERQQPGRREVLMDTPRLSVVNRHIF